MGQRLAHDVVGGATLPRAAALGNAGHPAIATLAGLQGQGGGCKGRATAAAGRRPSTDTVRDPLK